MNYILPKSSMWWDKAKSNQGGATDHKFLMKLHKITVFEVCVTSWIQRYFENYRFVVWPHISSQANNKHKHHHHQNIHWLINMKLAVLTYYDRNYVVDTSLASSAKISFYIFYAVYILEFNFIHNENVFNVTKFCWLQILKYLQF